MEWISVKDRLPPDGVEVLRWPGWANIITIDQWAERYNSFLMDINEPSAATHWMPLPVPPTRGRE